MTRRQTLNGTPAALVGVTAGTGFAVQVVGGAEVYLATAASAPAAGDPAFIRRPRETISLQPGTGEFIYGWTAGRGAVVAYEESF